MQLKHQMLSTYCLFLFKKEFKTKQMSEQHVQSITPQLSQDMARNVTRLVEMEHQGSKQGRHVVLRGVGRTDTGGLRGFLDPPWLQLKCIRRRCPRALYILASSPCGCTCTKVEVTGKQARLRQIPHLGRGGGGC